MIGSVVQFSEHYIYTYIQFLPSAHTGISNKKPSLVYIYTYRSKCSSLSVKIPILARL
jgi:hypothetical protein